MSKDKDNNQVITKYLLGSLPEPESERLDERSFTDDEFAAALKAAEKDLVDAYVQGELSDAALEQFTNHYLATPLRREQVEFARALQSLGEKPAVVITTGQHERRRFRWSSMFEIVSGRRLGWGLAAAALVLLVVGGVLVFQNLRLRQQLSETQGRQQALSQRERELQEQLSKERNTGSETEIELARVREELAQLNNPQRPTPEPQSIVSFILAPPIRGAGNVPSLTIPSKATTVALQIELEATNTTAYRVLLVDPSRNRVVWRSGLLKTREKARFLNVSFSATLVKPQIYVAQVSSIKTSGTAEPIGDYPFRVMKQ